MEPNFATWNPLTYLEDFPLVDELDLDEIHQLGLRTRSIAEEQGVELTFGTKVLGREVGDDRVDLSRTTAGLCCTLAVQEDVVHMVTSKEDTSVRKRSWNFCEVTSGPLTDPHQGYDFIRKNGDFSDLGFNDSIVLRLILDVQKGDGDDHSSTQPGKMSMLGSRLATPRRELRGIWMLASLFQDAMLCTHKASEPKYLPQVMGGTGVTALFDNSNNVFLYTLAYRGGVYRRIYATAVAEMRAYLYNLERGVQSAPVLCPRLREKQEYFWGTYDHMVFVPGHLPIGEKDDPPPPLYTMTGGQNRYQNFENRLLRTRHVVTRRMAQVEWAHTRRLRHIFQSLFPQMMDFEAIDKERSMTLRARYDYALSSNTALQNLLRRQAGKSDAIKMMGDSAFRTLTVGKLDFTREDAMWVYLNGQGENYSLNDVSLSEDIFVREEVSAEETFKVAGIPLRPYFSHGEELRPTRSKVGLYQINSSMEEWAENLLERLKSARSQKGAPLDPSEVGPIFDQDREWVNDDSGLIAMCHRDVSGPMNRYTVALISKDRRLANQMAETCNVTVIRIHPRTYVEACALRGRSGQEVHNDLLEEAGVIANYVYIDTGSLSASAVHYVEDDGTTYRRTLRSTGWKEGSRFSEITLTKVKRVKLLKELHHPITRPRVWRSTSRPQESVYSTHSSWRASHRSSRSDASWWRDHSRPLASRRDSFNPTGRSPCATARASSSSVTR